MVITPAQYAQTPVYDLLVEAAQGRLGFDQRLVRAIVERGEQAVQDIVRFGFGDRSSDRVRLEEDLIAILEHLACPQGLPFLIACLRQEPLDPSEELIRALQRLGPEAIGPLVELYGELGHEKGGDVAFILATFRNRDPRILQLLVDRIPYDAGDAAFLLGVFGDPAAKPVLEELIERATKDPSLARSLGNEAEEALSALECTVVEDPPVPTSIFDLYPEAIEPLFDVLTVEEKIEFLQSDSAELRADCARSFIDQELPEEVAKLLIEMARTDPNVGVRAVACAALGSRADEAPVWALLREKLEDGAAPAAERCGALVGLASRLRDDAELKTYVERFYSDPATRARALEAMWRSMDPSYAPLFRQHLEDPDIDIRRQAIKGIGFLEVSSEASRLVPLFQDEEFRLDALFSYALCVSVERLERGEMAALLRRIEEIAGGLSEHEGEVVETALDTRLILHGQEPVFSPAGARDLD
ncbi:MAG: HEAT repeat domain-containing protein [Bryobacteraceae bacterium]|nr:HEAT repeat domain-containing protein [Bryobacteraceae bacterium]MDW8376878.1 HEAT repeat domain-containing protein [Bryobacterales bacterium]